MCYFVSRLVRWCLIENSTLCVPRSLPEHSSCCFSGSSGKENLVSVNSQLCLEFSNDLRPILTVNITSIL